LSGLPLLYGFGYLLAALRVAWCNALREDRLSIAQGILARPDRFSHGIRTHHGEPERSSLTRGEDEITWPARANTR
jgi:hypothetical protein